MSSTAPLSMEVLRSSPPSPPASVDRLWSFSTEVLGEVRQEVAVLRGGSPLAVCVVGGFEMKLRQHGTVRGGIEASRQLESERLLVDELILRGAGDGAVVGEARRTLVRDHAGVFGGAQVVFVTVIRRARSAPSISAASC